MTSITGSNAVFTIQAYEKKLQRNPGDCGFDLYPVVEKESDIVITDLGFYTVLAVPTRIHVAIPSHCFAMVTGRSSSVNKLMGCEVLQGVIDHGYTGEYLIRVRVPNVSVDVTRIWKLISSIYRMASENVALAQAIIIPFIEPAFYLVDQLDQTARGNRGYGSTDGMTLDEENQQALAKGYNGGFETKDTL